MGDVGDPVDPREEAVGCGDSLDSLLDLTTVGYSQYLTVFSGTASGPPLASWRL